MADKQEPLGGGFEPDPARYREAAEPHASPEAAEQAVRDFSDAVGDLRVKYRITDMLVVYSVWVTETDGAEQRAMGIFAAGNQSDWEAMAAWAYGQEKAAQAARMRKLLSGS